MRKRQIPSAKPPQAFYARSIRSKRGLSQPRTRSASLRATTPRAIGCSRAWRQSGIASCKGSPTDWIGHHPEVGWHEFQAVDTLTTLLRSYGFQIDTVAGMPTAFVARWTSPGGANGPTLGLIAEYDALRGTQGDFHGDQHNAQSPVAFAAARALLEYMTQVRVPGRIIVYGTPAEEVDPPAKAILWKAGVFKGADILVRSHSSVETRRDRPGFGVCCLNIDAVKYTFTGRPAHQLTAWNGRNALEAAVQFYSAVDHLRSTWRPDHRVQGVIPEGGIAPNVVPDHTVVDYFIRFPDEVYLEHVARMMDDAAKGAAQMTETEVAITRYGEYRDGITVSALEELFFAYAKKFGAPGLQEEKGRPAGYEETGWVSRDIPGVGITTRSSSFANHTYGRRCGECMRRRSAQIQPYPRRAGRRFGSRTWSGLGSRPISSRKLEPPVSRPKRRSTRVSTSRSRARVMPT